MNADRVEAELAKRAVAEGWPLADFLRELRRQARNEMDAAPHPPEPTDEIPGTLEKVHVMRDRVRLGYAACHPLDTRLVNGIVVEATVNENGGDTELESRDEAEWRREHFTNKNDCDPAMTARLDRIGELLRRTRRGRRG